MEKLALSIGGTPIVGPKGVPTGGTIELSKIISVGFELLIIVAILLALLYIIWGGFDWITSEGQKDKIKSAQQKVVFAIIGLGFVFISFLLIFTFQHIFLGNDNVPPCARPLPGQSNPC